MHSKQDKKTVRQITMINCRTVFYLSGSINFLLLK